MEISTDTIMLLIFVFIIAAYLGVELISKVPSQLHTPLMSGTNAISGMAINASGNHVFGIILGTIAIFFATVNVIGGYLVTDRMLAMFKKKEAPKK